MTNVTEPSTEYLIRYNAFSPCSPTRRRGGRRTGNFSYSLRLATAAKSPQSRSKRGRMVGRGRFAAFADDSAVPDKERATLERARGPDPRLAEREPAAAAMPRLPPETIAHYHAACASCSRGGSTASTAAASSLTRPLRIAYSPALNAAGTSASRDFRAARLGGGAAMRCRDGSAAPTFPVRATDRS
jgi:hypothetical protein